MFIPGWLFPVEDLTTVYLWPVRMVQRAKTSQAMVEPAECFPSHDCGDTPVPKLSGLLTGLSGNFHEIMLPRMGLGQVTGSLASMLTCVLYKVFLLFVFVFYLCCLWWYRNQPKSLRKCSLSESSLWFLVTQSITFVLCCFDLFFCLRSCVQINFPVSLLHNFTSYNGYFVSFLWKFWK